MRCIGRNEDVFESDDVHTDQGRPKARDICIVERKVLFIATTIGHPAPSLV